MRRVQLLCVVWLLACSGQRETKSTTIELGSAVAPPLGLDALRGGEPREQAQKTLARLKPASAGDGLVLEGAGGGVEARVLIDHGRVADVAIDIADCRDVEGRLERTWSPFRRAAQTWSDPATGWTADLQERSSGCQLRFTHAAYFGSRPAAFGAAGDLRTGMSGEEAQHIAPKVAGEKTTPLNAVIGAEEGVMFDHLGKIVAQYYVLPRRAVEALRLAWGPGSRIPIPPDAESELWIAAETRTHAALAQVNASSNLWTLRLSSYTPLHDWLGEGARLAVLPDDVWTTQLSVLAREHPELDVDVEARAINLPAVEWSPFTGTQAIVHLGDNQLPQHALMTLPYPNMQVRGDMLRAFEEKWGKSSVTNKRWTFENGPGVVAEDGDSAWSLTVSAR